MFLHVWFTAVNCLGGCFVVFIFMIWHKKQPRIYKGPIVWFSAVSVAMEMSWDTMLWYQNDGRFTMSLQHYRTAAVLPDLTGTSCTPQSISLINIVIISGWQISPKYLCAEDIDNVCSLERSKMFIRSQQCFSTKRGPWMRHPDVTGQFSLRFQTEFTFCLSQRSLNASVEWDNKLKDRTVGTVSAVAQSLSQRLQHFISTMGWVFCLVLGP